MKETKKLSNFEIKISFRSRIGTILFLATLYLLLSTCVSFSFEKEALLDQIKETSLMNDIRWIENKGQLSISREQNRAFYESIKYYAKTPWGYFLIKDDKAVILNFIKPVKYTKDNVIVLVEQPDWKETAKKELDLSSKKIAKLKEEGFVEANGKEIYLEKEYREQSIPKDPERFQETYGTGKFSGQAENRKGKKDLSPTTYHLQPDRENSLDQFNASYRSYNLEVSVNGKKAVKIEPQGERAEKQSFFKGRDSSKWVSGLTTYNEIWAYFEEGVVFRFYAKEGKKIDPERFQGTSGVEKEVIIPEGIDLEDVYLAYASDEEFELSVEDDKLLINFDGYEFTEQVPFAYVIDENNERKEVRANYVLLPTTYNLSPITYHLSPANDEHGSFSKVCQIKSEWNGDGTFIFDPLLSSTYLSGSKNDEGYTLTLDTSGNVYITGYTKSTDFPTTGGVYDETGDGDTSYEDAFISKLNSTLTTLSASTYLGGSDVDIGYGIILDSSEDNVYVAGWTTSTDFPTTGGAYDETYNGGASDVFISKLNSTLTTLSAATYLGGSIDECNEYSCPITLDTSGNVYVTGDTTSTDFPTTGGAYDETGDGSTSSQDVFISKLNSNLTTLSASTYLGGSDDDDVVYFITLDTSGNVYVTGYTQCSDFPTTGGAYAETYNGGTYDIFISKLNSTLTTLSASTHLGGSLSEWGYSITLDSSEDNVYVTGFTGSLDFPTTGGAYDETGDGLSAYSDIFVSKLNSTLTTLSASTYLGGSEGERGYSLTLDASANVYVTGYTECSDFPTTGGAYDETYNGGSYDIFISKFNSTLTTLSACTYLGGSSTDYGGYFITLDSSEENVYVTGFIKSTDFPTTTGAYDETGTGSTIYRTSFISRFTTDLTLVSSDRYYGGSDDGYSLAEDTSGSALGYSAKTQLNFSTSPSNSDPGVAFPTQPEVVVQDTYGNTVLDATDSVALAINNNPTGGTLSGTNPVSASSGVATFSGLSIDIPGPGYTLEASSGALTPDTSSSFNINGPWVSGVSGSQLTDGTDRVQITYTAHHTSSTNCNLTTSADQVQYSQDDSTYYDATLSGTTSGITTSPAGIQHSDLYWEAATDLDDTEDSTVYLRLKTGDGTYLAGYSSSSSFSLDTKAPTNVSISSPSEGANDVTTDPTITATTASDANSVEYYFQLDTVTTFDSGNLQERTWNSSASWAPSTLSNHTTYYVRVKARDSYQNESVYCGSTIDTTGYTTFFTNNLPVTSAASGSQLTDGTKRVLISYTATDADSDNCSLINDTSQVQYSSNNVDWYEATISGTTSGITATPGGTAHNDLYWEAGTDLNDTEDSTVYFLMKLYDGYAYEATFVGTGDFALDTKAPTNVSISSPSDGADYVSKTPTITATTASDPAGGIEYYFQLDTSTGFDSGNLQERTWNASASWVPSTLENNTTYYVHVKARDNYQNESSYCGPTVDVSGYTTFTTNYLPNASSVSGSQLTDGTKRVLISYTAADGDSDSCNLTTSATQAQYSQNDSDWYDAALSGTTTGITTSPGGTAHNDLYWEAGADLNNTEDATVYFRIMLHDGHDYQIAYGTAPAFVMDTLVPSISAATSFSSSPVAGDTSINLTSTWTETNYSSATSSFDYALDGESYAGGTAGSSGTLTPTANVSLGTTLNGHSYISKIKSSLSDDYGNASSESEDTADVGVKPYSPAGPQVLNARYSTIDVTVIEHPSEASGLEYALYIEPAVGGNNYVQADGSVGVSAVWQNIGSWGTVTVTGLSEDTNYTFKTKSRNFHITSLESDFSSAIGISTLSAHGINVTYRYVSNTQVEFLVWLEQGGQTVTSGLSGTATVNLHNADGSSIAATGNTDATADSQGMYSITPTRTSGTFDSNTAYYANISLPYGGKTYTKNIFFKVDTDSSNFTSILEDTGTTLPSSLTTLEGKIDTADIVADTILIDTGTTLPSSLTTLEGKIDTIDPIVDSILADTGTTLPAALTTFEGKMDDLDAVVDSILLDTGTTLPGEITAARDEVVAEMAKGLKAKILNRPTTATTGDVLTIRYKTDSGLGPIIDVYDADGTKRVDGIGMSEIGSTGVYEYDLTLSSGWSTGDFTIVCSEASTSSVDSMILSVIPAASALSYNLNTVEDKIDILDTNLDALVTNIASVKSTVEDTNSDLATVQSDVNSIITKWGSYTASDLESDTGNLGTYIGTPDDASGTDTVFGRLAQVYDATGTISSASTYAQNAYDEIQSLRNEVSLNGKTNTAYQMLVSLNNTLSDLQTSMGTIPAQSSSVRIEEIYNSISQDILELKGLIAAEGQEVAVTEAEAVEKDIGMTELANQLNELKTLVEIARSLVEKTTEEPVVKSWFEVK